MAGDLLRSFRNTGRRVSSCGTIGTQPADARLDRLPSQVLRAIHPSRERSKGKSLQSSNYLDVIASQKLFKLSLRFSAIFLVLDDVLRSRTCALPSKEMAARQSPISAMQDLLIARAQHAMHRKLALRAMLFHLVATSVLQCASRSFNALLIESKRCARARCETRTGSISINANAQRGGRSQRCHKFFRDKYLRNDRGIVESDTCNRALPLPARRRGRLCTARATFPAARL